MKKFIIGVGKFLKNDYIMYNIFKWIMLNMNKIFHIVLVALNVYLYTKIGCGCSNGEVVLAVLNLIFSIVLAISIIYHLVYNYENDDLLFHTEEYKDYFYDIEMDTLN